MTRCIWMLIITGSSGIQEFLEQCNGALSVTCRLFDMLSQVKTVAVTKLQAVHRGLRGRAAARQRRERGAQASFSVCSFTRQPPSFCT